ncbi:MAG: TonB-dependent receptor [Acidobacteriota bacterium]|nr:TonB-dependent receptor [Acidobacteriota bacterium]
MFTKQFFQALVVFSFSLALCIGQTFTASLTGVVTDPKQAGIPGATLKLLNTGTNDTRESTTGTDGRYTFSQLLPGNYELTAEAKGFKIFVQRGMNLRASQSAELNLPMQLGDVTQSVEVASAPVMLDTQSANEAVTLTAQQITDLPTNVRTPLALVQTMAGTTTSTFGQTGAFDAQFDQNFSAFGLNGGRDMSTAILIDGVPATAADWGGLVISPSVDSVQEMQIIRNTYDAQFGKSGGGVVSMVTKGGTNAFHGTAFEFLRNDDLDANTWSNNRAGRPITEFRRHQFGGNVGGPIWKSKRLYFFGGYEGRREATPGSSGFLTLPTDLERQGDFSQSFNSDGSLAVIYNPFTTRPDPATSGRFLRDPFPGNKIPGNLLDPVAVKVLSLYPKPNLPGDPFTHARNFYLPAQGVVTNDRFDSRVDWAHNEKHTMYVRFSAAPREDNVAPVFFGNGADPNKSDINPRFHGTFGNTFVPDPSWVINILAGAGRWHEGQLSPSLGLNATNAGFSPAVASLFQGATIPGFSFQDYAAVGNPQIRDFVRYNYDLQVNATKQKGAHSIKFGSMMESALINNIDRRSADFSFNRGLTSGPNAATSSTTTGNAVASLLLGTAASGSTYIRPDIAASLRYYGGYVQDDWHVGRRLTLNIGLRYEYQSPGTERYDRFTYFDPNAKNSLSAQAGIPLNGALKYVTKDNRGAWEPDKRNFAPRIGIAFKLTDKLVVRAGYGIFYANASDLFTFDPGQVAGFGTTTSAVTTVGGGGLIPQDLLRNPFPTGINPPVGNAQGDLTQVGSNLDQVWLRNPHPTGYKQNRSLDLQYEISHSTVLEVGYSGFAARRLVFGQPRESNQMPPQFLSLGPALDQQIPNPFFGVITRGVLAGPTIPRQRLLRPYPQYSSVVLTRSIPGASADYNALIAKFSKQFSHGLTLLANYQWSKNLDNASEDQGWGINDRWRNFYDLKLDRSISAHDVPHSFVTSLVYELPVGKGRQMGGNLPAVADAVLGGWEVSSIVRLQSGLPVQPDAPNQLSAYGFQTQRPNRTSNSVGVSNRTPDNWFNTGAFAAAVPYTIGNAPRYMTELRTDSIRNLDVSLMKTFRFREWFRLQFRGEFFNLLNMPQFGSISTSVGGNTYGKATGTINDPRNIQLGLKLYF